MNQASFFTKSQSYCMSIWWLYSALAKRYIHPLCPIKKMCVYTLIIVVLCDVQSTLHYYTISIIHDKFHLPNTKTPFMVNFFMYLSSFCIIIVKKNMNDEFLKVNCPKHVQNVIAHIFLFGESFHKMQNSPNYKVMWQWYFSKFNEIVTFIL